MHNCRSIPKSVWEHARVALVFYFSRRHGLDHSEDLAQDTLATIWARTDFTFQAEEDFLRVCLGFARKISFQAYRQHSREPRHGLDELPPVVHECVRLSEPERKILLEEVLRIGRAQIKDFELLEKEAGGSEGTPKSGNTRVRLFRARQKLAELTGWRRK